MKKLIKRFLTRETIMYLIFGLLTTIISLGTYALMAQLADIDYRTATVASWAVAVIFAFITNKIFVFRSSDYSPIVIAKEFASFVGSRLLTGAFDLIFMIVAVDALKMNDMIAKIVAAIIVTILNYVFSKLLVFNKRQKGRFRLAAEKAFDKNKYVYYSALFTLGILMFVFAIYGIYPFGDYSVLRVDLYHQYAPFFEELRYKLLNGESLFYSFDGGLGKNFLAQFAYYSSSPISFLIVLFPNTFITEAIAVFVIIKICLASTTFSIYLKRGHNRHDIISTVFSVCYGLSSFVIAYYWNVMWLDSVYLFPLIALGIESMVKKGNVVLYFFALTLTIITNFYMAIMVCFFTVLYFLAVHISHNYEKKRYYISRMIKFGTVSLLAGGASAFLIITQFIAIQNTASYGSTMPKSFEFYFNFFEFLTNHYAAIPTSVLTKNYAVPNIYCGLLTFLILPFTMISKNINLREKFSFLIILTVMFFASNVNILDFLIHGMHFPANLPHRFSFMYSFIILMLGYRTFVSFSKIPIGWVMISCFGALAFVLLSFFGVFPQSYSDMRDAKIPWYFLLINIVLIIAYASTFIVYRFDIITKKMFVGTVAAICITELVVSSTLNIHYQGFSKRSYYVSFMDDMKKVVAKLNKDTDDFFRTEFNRWLTVNDAALYHYNGVTEFSSIIYAKVTDLMEDLGLPASMNSYKYFEATPVVDLMYNVRYLLSRDSAIDKTTFSYKSKIGKIFMYENPYPMPLGFMVDEETRNLNLNLSNPFSVQNDFMNKASKLHDDVFKEIRPTGVVGENIELTDGSSNNYSYKVSKPEDLDSKPTINVFIYNDVKQKLYLYVSSYYTSRIKVEIDDRASWYDVSQGKSTIYLGNIPENTEVNVEIDVAKKVNADTSYTSSGTAKINLVSFDEAAFEVKYEKLKQSSLNLDVFKDAYFSGSISVDEDGIMYTSIPYDKSWIVNVDGVEVETEKIADALLGIPLSAGEHTVELKFVPVGIVEGALISMASLLAFLGFALLTARKRKYEVVDIVEFDYVDEKELYVPSLLEIDEMKDRAYEEMRMFLAVDIEQDEVGQVEIGQDETGQVDSEKQNV